MAYSHMSCKRCRACTDLVHLLTNQYLALRGISLSDNILYIFSKSESNNDAYSLHPGIAASCLIMDSRDGGGSHIECAPGCQHSEDADPYDVRPSASLP